MKVSPNSVSDDGPARASIAGVRDGRQQSFRDGQLPWLCYGGESSHQPEEVAPGVRLREWEGRIRHSSGPLSANIERSYVRRMDHHPAPRDAFVRVGSLVRIAKFGNFAWHRNGTAIRGFVL